MPEIESMEQISDLIRKGETNWKQYGDVYTNEHDGLILFNYTQEAQFAGRWNWFERHARGLIFDKDSGMLMARPFSKFYNWLEGGRKAFGHIEYVTEKMDGSLGIAFMYDGHWRMATRGSLTSDQSRKGEAWLNHYYNTDRLNPDVTYLFEIIYPANRVVVDYGKREGLWLLAGINCDTGKELDFWTDIPYLIDECGFEAPKVYTFNAIEDIIAAAGSLDANHEGWVVKFSDGSRWKFKGDRYRELHKLITGLSKKRVFEAMRGDVYLDMLMRIPEEFRAEVEQWHDEIKEMYLTILAAVNDAWWHRPEGIVPRKEFAIWNTQNHPRWLQNILFQLYDERPIEDMIWKRVEEQLGEKENA